MPMPWRILTSALSRVPMPGMRTTLTLDPDVERLLQREIQRTGSSMKAVVNDALRLGLGMRAEPSPPLRYEVEPHDFGIRPGIDRDSLTRLVDELEAEEFDRRRDP